MSRPYASEGRYLWLALTLAFLALVGAAACGNRPARQQGAPLGWRNPYPTAERMAACKGKPLERKRCLEAQ